MTDQPYGDPLSIPFWEAATRHELVLQRCSSCDRFQHYPRPLCLACYGEDLSWVVASGRATVYSQTTVHLTGSPYTVAVVELDEGPRLTTWIVGREVAIGDRVTLGWHERGALPPLPIFTATS